MAQYIVFYLWVECYVPYYYWNDILKIHRYWSVQDKIVFNGKRKETKRTNCILAQAKWAFGNCWLLSKGWKLSRL